MSIRAEMNEFFKLIMEHPDEIEKTNLYIKLKNGTVFRYKLDKRKEDKLKMKAEAKRIKEEEKQKKLEIKKHNKKENDNI